MSLIPHETEGGLGHCFFAFLGAMRQINLKKFVIFLPHNSASNFEALCHRNSQWSLAPHEAGALFFCLFSGAIRQTK